MQMHLHQAAVITAFGNEYFRTGMINSAFWPKNAVFEHNKSVTFVEGMPKPGAAYPEIAGDPMRWLSWLKANGVWGLRMVYSARNEPHEDYNTVVFGGGGNWIVEALRASTSDLWEAISTVAEKDAPDKKIWATVFHRTVADFMQHPIEVFDLSFARARLNDILPRALAFARSHEELKDFVDFFSGAIKRLNSNKPLAQDSIAQFYECSVMPLAARQILGCVNNAWVFGGMSWWNDHSFEDTGVQKDYLALTAELWETLARSLVYATNSTMPMPAAAATARR